MPLSPLATFVAQTRDQANWTALSRKGDLEETVLTSGSWHGATWKHPLVIVHPTHEDRRHTAILFITGDRVSRTPDPDLVQARTLARRSHFPVAVLFGVPSQPLNGMREDDLIAWSFGEYLKSGDATWPALFPMVRSGVRAMDAICAVTRGRGNAIRKFLVTGESKRGWTTWLIGACNDPRVVGIAPVSFDFLDFPAQIRRQIELWGKPSEMLGSYTGSGLLEVMKSDAGKRLLGLVDPISYLVSYRVPTLIARGSNDPYWATDATRLYFDRLRQPHSLLVLPNEGHDFGTNQMYLSTVAAFARSCSGAFAWCPPRKVHPFDFWAAASSSGDLRKAHWTTKDSMESFTAGFGLWPEGAKEHGVVSRYWYAEPIYFPRVGGQASGRLAGGNYMHALGSGPRQ